MVLLVHVASTNVPFTSESKEETKSISFGSDITDLDITKPEKQKVTISD
jgi:DNA topoisomerase VI subunit B